MASFAEVTPTGSINGVNRTFTWTGTSTSVELYRRGLLVASGDFTLTVASGTSTASFAAGAIPQSGDSLTAWIYTA